MKSPLGREHGSRPVVELMCVRISKEMSEAGVHEVREKIVGNGVKKVRESRRCEILETIVRISSVTLSGSFLSEFSIVPCSLGSNTVVILMLVTTWFGTKC